MGHYGHPDLASDHSSKRCVGDVWSIPEPYGIRLYDSLFIGIDHVPSIPEFSHLIDLPNFVAHRMEEKSHVKVSYNIYYILKAQYGSLK
jgi:hypothetical protein